MAKIGWIGIGNMGKNMARLAMGAGHELYMYDSNPEQMLELEKEGASILGSAAELAKTVDFLFSTIPNGKVLHAITFGANGIAAGVTPGTIYTDISTVDVAASAEVAAAMDQAGAHFLRSPVSGSTIQAGNGTLTVMVSGDKAAYEKTKPFFDLFGRDVYYMGGGDEARVMKLVIQTMVGVQFQSYAEALVLGEKAGVDWETMIEIISHCSAASTNIRNKTDAFKKRDFSAMSTVFTQLKDMNLVMDLARAYNVPLPITSVSTQYYNAMAATGRGNYDYSAILLVNEENCGIRHEAKLRGPQKEDVIA